MRLSGQLPGHEYQVGDDFVVVTSAGDDRVEEMPVRLRVQEKALRGGRGGKHYRIEMDHAAARPGDPRSCNGAPFCAQIERIGARRTA